ncbi:MAG: hypothetical protein FWD49_05915 [Firmicutes bacterium]|nr:hypothetical protein [Bacillota bacterium]
MKGVLKLRRDNIVSLTERAINSERVYYEDNNYDLFMAEKRRRDSAKAGGISPKIGEYGYRVSGTEAEVPAIDISIFGGAGFADASEMLFGSGEPVVKDYSHATPERNRARSILFGQADLNTKDTSYQEDSFKAHDYSAPKPMGYYGNYSEYMQAMWNREAPSADRILTEDEFYTQKCNGVYADSKNDYTQNTSNSVAIATKNGGLNKKGKLLVAGYICLIGVIALIIGLVA